MKIKKFKIILSLFLIIGIAAGGVLGYYDARLEAAVNNKNGSTLTDVKVDDNLTFNKNVINILLVETVVRNRPYSPSWLSMDSLVHPCTSAATYRSDFKHTLSYCVDSFGMYMYARFLRLWMSLNII